MRYISVNTVWHLLCKINEKTTKSIKKRVKESVFKFITIII